MTNIPTELLRTLIAVVDLRSFTKAAQSLGVTQPAVSAQIKRLQSLLGTDLLDKRATGVSLTPSGEMVVNYARRLLSINDQILDLATPRAATKCIRIGITGDFAAAGVSLGLTSCRVQRPDLRFALYTAPVDSLLKDIGDGSTDLAVWASASAPAISTTHYWAEELVWMHSASTRIELGQPVPLVSYGEQCVFTQSAMAALSQANRTCDLMYVGSSIAGLAAAVAAGFGVMVLPRSCADIPGVAIWQQTPLPKLPEIYCGIYLRAGAETEDREQVADAIAAALRPMPRGVPQSHGGVGASIAAAPEIA